MSEIGFWKRSQCIDLRHIFHFWNLITANLIKLTDVLSIIIIIQGPKYWNMFLKMFLSRN